MTVPVTAAVQTCVLKYKESVVTGSFAVSVCCRLVSRPEAPVRWCAAWVCVAEPLPPSMVRVCRQIHLCRRILSAAVRSDCAHTFMLQKASVRGRGLSSAVNGSGDGDCADMCFLFIGTPMSWALFWRCPCVAHPCPLQRRLLAVTIAGAMHVWLSRIHTCVLLQPRVRGHASACGCVWMGRTQLPVCWTNVCSTLGS